MGQDANDILRTDGPAVLREALDTPSGAHDPVEALDPDRELSIGSEAEVASRVIEDLRNHFGEVVFSEGDFWIWNSLNWERLSETSLYLYIRAFDGRWYRGSDDGKARQFKLSDRSRKGIQRLVAIELREDDFFKNGAVGINIRNGFVRFDNGQPKLTPHDRGHRLRHVLDIEWDGKTLGQLPQDSLLLTLIDGCFRGDEDAQAKSDCLAEVCAAALLGLATKLASPKAVVLYGPSAGNGKSRFLKLFRAMLPEQAVSTLTPQQLGDERMRATLPGVLLNGADELGSAAIRSDTFKAAITGEKTTARQVYQVPVTFAPIAQHLFATNALPPFSDGMDAGVLRRLLIIPFNRTIPESERIARIDELIILKEGHLLFAWILAGAVRLLARGGFTEIPSGQSVVQDWTQLSDPISAWLDDHEFVEVTGEPSDYVRVREAHAHFHKWGESVGLSKLALPWQKVFTQRISKLARQDIAIVHKKIGNVLSGVRLKHPPPLRGDAYRPKGDG